MDLEFDPTLIQVGIESVFEFQKDRNVSSGLTDLKISYLWRPRLDDEFMNAIERFIDQPPYLIITGIINHLYNGFPIYFKGLGSHHIIKRIVDSPRHHNLEIFEQRMKELLIPAMRRLISAGTRLIWMNQFPMLGLPLDRKESENMYMLLL